MVPFKEQQEPEQEREEEGAASMYLSASSLLYIGPMNLEGASKAANSLISSQTIHEHIDLQSQAYAALEGIQPHLDLWDRPGLG